MRYSRFGSATLILMLLVCSQVVWTRAGVPVATEYSSVSTDDMLRTLYASGDFAIKTLNSPQWSSDGRTYTVLEPASPASVESDIVEYSITTGARRVLVRAADLVESHSALPINIESYAWAKDRSRVLIFTNSKPVWRQNTRGDYWVYDLQTTVLLKLGGNAAPAALMFAKFSPDGKRVAYVRANNLFVEDLGREGLRTDRIVQLTTDGSETIINGTADWVNEEEFFIRDGFRWSPDGTKIAYWQFDTSKVGRFTLVYNLGTPRDVVTGIPYPNLAPYPESVQFPYPLAGTRNSAVRVGVIAAESGGSTSWMNVPGDPRNNYVARMGWAANSKELVLQHVNRAQNRNDVLLADAQSGAVRQIYSDQDNAWVDVMDDVRWLDGGEEFILLSEHDGWRHAYSISRDGSQVRLVTPGPMDVIEVLRIDEKAGWLYFMASPENATQRYLFRSRLDGSSSAERITALSSTGTHVYNISPDALFAFHTYSSFDVPPVLELINIPGHQTIRRLEDNARVRSNVSALTRNPVEFFRVRIGKDVSLDGWMMKPPNFDSKKRYPLLVYVYGEPWGQTVLDSWEDGRSFWHFGLFHRIVANAGYLVVSFDNRGTPAPKGRAWRKAVHNAMGPLVYDEQAAALQQIERARPYIDPTRVAVWGWSGGGTSTLNLLFRHPDLYQVGMAVAPVPDQRLYDTIYQERYMGLPQENVTGYRESAAINFAEGLRGHLLLIHSSGDDNVHFQGSELLINRLVELKKQFDFMEYPARTHELEEGAMTRLHVHALLLRYLEEHLPPTLPDRRF